MKKKTVWFHTLIKDTKHFCENCPDEDGLKLFGKYRDILIATYELEGWLNQWYPSLFYFNEYKQEYINRETGECVGRIVKHRE